MAKENTKTNATENHAKERTYHFNVRFLKDEKSFDDVTALCKWHIETLRLESMKKSVSGIVNALEKNHAKIDAMKASDASIRKNLSGCEFRGKRYDVRDAENFLVNRKKINEQESRVDDLDVLIKTLNDGVDVCSEIWPTLEKQDRNMINNICFPNYRGFTLDTAILESEEKGDDGKPVRYAFAKYIVDKFSGTGNGKLKDDIRSTFNRFFGSEGKLFKAVQVQKSGIDIWDINHTVAGCGGTAKYNAETGRFLFVCDTSDTKVCKVLMQLSAVLFDKGAFVEKAVTEQDEKTA